MPHEIPNLISVAEAQEPAPVAVISLTTREEMEAYITREYPVYAQDITRVIDCESGWDTHAKGDFRHGEPTSFGLAQLHNPETDWGLSVEEAYNPKIAIDTMAEAFAKGQQERWSCY